MSASRSPRLLAAGALVWLGLAGCNSPQEVVAQPPAQAEAITPDPDAPPLGSEAAEAIGVGPAAPTP